MLTSVDINFLLSELCVVRCDGGAGVPSSNTALTYYPNDHEVLGSHLIVGHTFFSRLTPFLTNYHLPWWIVSQDFEKLVILVKLSKLPVKAWS